MKKNRSLRETVSLSVVNTVSESRGKKSAGKIVADLKKKVTQVEVPGFSI